MKNMNEVCFKGNRVIVRVDFNVPLDNEFNIIDNSRILAALPTINKLISDGAKVILISHLGRPKGVEGRFSLKPVVIHLSELLNMEVGFMENCVGEKTKELVSKMKNGEVVVLENLRFYPQEKKGDVNFAKKIANLGDVFINDAFGSAHRAHASTSIISRFFLGRKYFGLLLKKEMENLEKALKNPKKPFTAIIGGAKVSDKIEVIKSLLNKVDNLIIGGGMAYTFSKAMNGHIGNSLIENDKIDLAKSLIIKAENKGVNFILPIDSVNADKFNNNANVNISKIINIPDGFMGLDIGEKSIEIFSRVILSSKTIIWNGPMGVFEMSNFENGTKKIGDAICRASEMGAFSLIGGGDSVAAIKKFGLEKRVSYISTGGGALLEYLEGKNLPGIQAILE